MRYITSDLHFLHKNILKHSPNTRPFTNMGEMTECLIRSINSLENCEVLYHLGDFCFGNVNRQLRPIMEQIEVPIFFIWGNHDNHKMKNIVVDEYGHQGSHYIETKSNGKKVCMFHYPQYEWNMSHHGSIQLHGHLHGRFPHIQGKTIDVGWDAHGRILTLDEAVQIADNKPLYSPIHGE